MELVMENQFLPREVEPKRCGKCGLPQPNKIHSILGGRVVHYEGCCGDQHPVMEHDVLDTLAWVKHF